jgi:peptidylprolyl isomerase
MVLDIQRSEFPPDADPEAGQRFHASGPGVDRVTVTVVAVSEEAVTIDANHLMAGRDVVFEIELLEIL